MNKTAELIGRQDLNERTAIDLASRLLDKAAGDLGADGYALFVRDPVVSDVFHCRLMKGLRYPEMESGFAGLSPTRWHFPNEDSVIVCTKLSQALEELPMGK